MPDAVEGREIMKEHLRELAGKGCVCSIALIFGVFIANELLWSISVPRWIGYIAGLAATVGIAWFLLSDSKK